MMDLLGSDLSAIKGKRRVAVRDHRAPLMSPVTLVVMLLKAAGFEWYGADKRLADGSTGTSCFLDTTTAYADGTKARSVTWTFTGDTVVEIGGDRVGIHAMAHALGYSAFSGTRPLGRGAATVLSSVHTVAPLAGEMLFNERGKRLHAACHAAGNREARELLTEALELYRGFCWKLSTPVDHPPHAVYGYPLDRHLRYHRGKRRGDVRQSLEFDHRMDELKTLGLR